MSIEEFDKEVIKNGVKIYNPNKKFAAEYSEVLRLFSLYISFDPDYNYSKSYLIDKISEFSREMNRYYRKHLIIEEATKEWALSVPVEKKLLLENIKITFDDTFQFDPYLIRLTLLKMPSLIDIESNTIRCRMEYKEIVECEWISLKSNNDRVYEDIKCSLTRFLENVVKYYGIGEECQDEK